MTLPASGPMSTLDMVGEYSSPEPGNTGQLYRNGSYVPDSIEETNIGSYGSTQFSAFSPRYFYEWNGPIYWNDVQIRGGGATDITGTYISGGYQYQAVADQGGGVYSVRRRTYAVVDTPVNQNVPESGANDTDNYYGGRGS